MTPFHVLIHIFYLISPTSVSVGGTATNGTVSIAPTQSDCSWTNTANVSWLTITDGLTGSGNGTLSYLVDANPTLNPRTGTMTIAGATFTVNQAGAFSLIREDIGNPGAAGNVSYSNGVFSVTGSGEDIEVTADDFYFVHQPLTGDGQIVAHVTSLAVADSAAEAGIMIRENLDAGSKHVFLRVNSQTNVVFRRRLATDAYSVETGSSPTNHSWLRLMRMGNTFIAHTSTNGIDWEYVWFTTVNMSNQAQTGLAVTAHRNGSYATATIDNVSIGNLSPIPGTWPLTGPKILLGGEAWGASEFQRVGGFKMLVGGVVRDRYDIKGSSDLSLPLTSWTVVGTVTNTYGVADFLDPRVAGNQVQFYRAILLP